VMIPLPFVFVFKIGRRGQGGARGGVGYPPVERGGPVSTPKLFWQRLPRPRRAGWLSTVISVFVSVLVSLFLTGFLIELLRGM
jgi:hypothetical protein